MHPRFQVNRIIKMLTSQVHYENIDSIDVLHLYTYNLLDHIMHFIFSELILQKPNNQYWLKVWLCLNKNEIQMNYYISLNNWGFCNKSKVN